MSWRQASDPDCTERAATPAIETIIAGRKRDIGGFSVERLLPAAARRRVGPFVFFDHMGPAALAAGQGLDVRPHPHINLATVTYLFEGEIVHRDSLGSLQPIQPGAINWMTAGRGIVHSERTSPELRRTGSRRARPAALGRAAESARGSRARICAPSGRYASRAGRGRRAPPRSRRERLRRRVAGAHALAAVLRRSDDACRQRAAGSDASTRSARRMSSKARSHAAAERVDAVAHGRFRCRLGRRVLRAEPQRAWCYSAARRSTAIATCGGTSSPARESASSRRSATGRKAGSPRCRERPSSSRCRTRHSSPPPRSSSPPAACPRRLPRCARIQRSPALPGAAAWRQSPR